MTEETGRQKNCPVCGRGVLQHLGPEAGPRQQQPDSPIIETYTCGHEVPEDRLETADAERLEVERRSSEETARNPEETARNPEGTANGT